MGALRTSEDGPVVAGDAKQAREDDHRTVDAPGKIIIDSAPIVVPQQLAAPRPPVPKPLPQPMPEAPRHTGGTWLVVVVYIVASAALAAALYERFGDRLG